MVEYIILSKWIKEHKEKDVMILIKKVAIETAIFKKDYPNYIDWFWQKQVAGLLEGSRDIIIAIKHNKIIGISNIKNTPFEKKICTLSVDKRYRMKKVGSKLVDLSLDLLGTKTPTITMSLYKLPEFRTIINKYNWVVTNCQKDLYKDGIYEVFFNDYQTENLEFDSKLLIKEINYNLYKIYCYYLLKKYSKLENNCHYQLENE